MSLIILRVTFTHLDFFLRDFNKFYLKKKDDVIKKQFFSFKQVIIYNILFLIDLTEIRRIILICILVPIYVLPNQ